MRQVIVFLALFTFVLTDIISAEMALTKEQQKAEVSPLRNSEVSDEVSKISNRVDTEQVVFAEERDPFSLSSELLNKTVSEKYVFFTGEGLSKFNLPRIEITGVMVVGDKTMATAKIETLGEVTLKPNERIVVKSMNSQEGTFTSFFIKEIMPSELVIILEGGQEVHGRFR